MEPTYGTEKVYMSIALCIYIHVPSYGRESLQKLLPAFLHCKL
jgi:hypothetical protein